MSMLFLSFLLLFCFLGCCCSDFWCFVVVIIVVPAIHELLNATTLFVLNVVPCSSAPIVTHWFTFQMILLRWKLSLSINKDNPAFAFPPVSPPNKILPDCFSFGQLFTSYPVSVKGIWDVTMMWWYVFPPSVSAPQFCFFFSFCFLLLFWAACHLLPPLCKLDMRCWHDDAVSQGSVAKWVWRALQERRPNPF